MPFIQQSLTKRPASHPLSIYEIKSAAALSPTPLINRLAARSERQALKNFSATTAEMKTVPFRP